jgi:uncharacterized protein YoaH (UPF0181 family)
MRTSYQTLISRTMTAQEAIKLVEDTLENHGLNLHEGMARYGDSEYQQEISAFEAALSLVKVVAK